MISANLSPHSGHGNNDTARPFVPTGGREQVLQKKEATSDDSDVASFDQFKIVALS